MRVSNIQLQGYRSLFDINWSPGDLNIIIGPNGSGKSNLLKALELLSMSADGKLGQHITSEGGINALLCGFQSTKVQFKLLCSQVNSGRESEFRSLTYQLDISPSNNSYGHKIDYEFLGDFSQFERRFKPKSLVMLERIPPSAVIYDEQNLSEIAPHKSVKAGETLLYSSSGGPGSSKQLSLYQDWLSRWQIYHDFLTHRDAPVRKPTIPRKETILASDGNNLVQVLYTLYEYNRDFHNGINTAMRAAFGSDFDGLSFLIDSNHHLQMQVNWKSLNRPQSAAELSDGTLRFLFLMTILLNPELPTLIAIDEPESGLHPSMLPVLAQYTRLAASQTQVIFTTHSEKFLDIFSACQPTITTSRIFAGKTHLDVLSGEALRYWLKECAFNLCIPNEELREAA